MIYNGFSFKKRWTWVSIPKDQTVMAARPLGCNLSYNRCCRVLSLQMLKQMGYTLENVLEVFNFLSSTRDFFSPRSLMLFACLLNPVALLWYGLISLESFVWVCVLIQLLLNCFGFAEWDMILFQADFLLASFKIPCKLAIITMYKAVEVTQYLALIFSSYE